MASVYDQRADGIVPPTDLDLLELVWEAPFLGTLHQAPLAGHNELMPLSRLPGLTAL